jgi:hypothetical protein
MADFEYQRIDGNTGGIPDGTRIKTSVDGGAYVQHVNVDNITTSTDDPIYIQAAEGKLPVVALPPELVVSMTGRVNGNEAYILNVLGSRSLGWSSTTVLGDCCDYLDTSQALMNTPATSDTLYLVSTSVNDAVAGTGAQVVHFEYLDASGNQQHAEVNTNGTTPVNLGTGFSFIQIMEVDRLGSAEVSAGNISITSTNGAATVATTFERITAGGNRSLSGRIKVPLGYTAYIIDWAAAAIGTTMDVRLRSTTHAMERTLSTVYHFEDRVFLASGANANANMFYTKCPALSVLKLSAIPGNAPAGNKFDGSIHVLFVKD